jgi:hypothetical protein
MLPPPPLTVPDVPISSILYLPHAVPGGCWRGGHAEWSVAKRRVPTAGRRPERRYLSGPSRFAGSNHRIPRRKQLRAPEPDMCTGETAATDAQWGARAFERQYRNWMGLRWLVCVRVHDQ